MVAFSGSKLVNRFEAISFACQYNCRGLGQRLVFYGTCHSKVFLWGPARDLSDASFTLYSPEQ